ncbi:MAG: ABC transporter permease [Candidatus Methanofastidiosia archaeon]|jgi:ABC-2 type transport system permease protein
MSITEQMRRSLAIAKKDLLIYFLKGPTLIFGLLLPSFLFVAFAMGRKLPADFLIPGLVGMTLFFTTSAVGPVIAPWETRMRTFERLVSTPIALWGIILGDVIASFIFGAGITLVVLVVGSVLVGFNAFSITVIVSTVVAAFCFSSLGVMLSSPPTDNPSNIMMLSTLVKFPLIFVSGVFIPLVDMGGVRVVSYMSPLTYYVDAVRCSVDMGYFNPVVDVGILIVFCVLFLTAAIVWHQKNLDKRF